MIGCLTRFGTSNGSFKTQLTCSFSQLSLLVKIVGSNFFFLALLQGMWNLSFPTRNQTFTTCRVLTTGLQGSPVVILRRFFLSSGTGVLGRRGHRCPGRTPIDWSWFQLCFSQKRSLWPRRSTLGLCSYLQLQAGERCSEDPADQKSPLSAVGDHLWMSAGHLGSCESLWGRADTDHALCALTVGRTHLTVR